MAPRDNPFTDSNKGYRQNANNQAQQLQNAKQLSDPTNGRWNDRTQTGFDDAADNSYDDYKNKQTNNMGYDNNGNSSDTNRGGSKQPFVNYSSRPSDYGKGDKLISDYQDFRERSRSADYKANLQDQTERQKNADANSANRLNFALQSGDRQLGIKTTAETQRENNYLTYQGNIYNFDKQSGDRQLGIQKNFEVGMDKNAGDKAVGLNRNATQLEASKYGDQLKTQLGVYQWSNLNPTSIAEAQIKAGTYGMDQNTLSNQANTKFNDDRNLRYADQQMQQNKYNQQVSDSNRSYSDQRSDQSNDRSAAMARYSQDSAWKATEFNYKQQQDAANRDWVKQQFSATTAQWDKDYALKQQTAANDYALRKQAIDNQTAQTNSNLALDNSKFTASRADLAYNRNIQSRSFAF
jgi:hypothetical protein